MGYGHEQVKELGATIDAVDCDLVLSATPIDLRRLIRPNKKLIHIRYELEEQGSPDLKEVLAGF
jgi:predicted GTPase